MLNSALSTPDYSKLTHECTKAKLKDKIDALSRIPTPLSIVPKSNFPDLFSLVAHLKVAAQTRNFSLDTNFSIQNGFKLKCNSRVSTAALDCPVYFILEELSYGRFRIRKARVDHIHEIPKLKIDVGIENIGLRGEPRRGDRRGVVQDYKLEISEEAEKEEDEADSGSDSDVEIISTTMNSRIPTSSTFEKVSQRLVFRTHRDIQAEVAKLVAGPRLPFPTSSNRIAIKDHDAFRIYAQASAQQNNFKLQVNNSTPTTDLHTGTRFRLNCARNDSRFIGQNRCTCKILVVSSEVREGEKVWTVKSETDHNEACLLSREEVEEIREEVRPLQLSLKKSSRPISPLDDSIAIKKRPRLSTIAVKLQQKLFKSKRSIPDNKSTAISIAQLSSFLYQISPVLSNQATLLFPQGGIQTREHLVNLISMSSSSLDFFLERLQIESIEGRMKVVQKFTFTSKVTEIRENLQRRNEVEH